MTTKDVPAAVPTRLDRLRPAPWNPRTIRDYRFQSLCRSLEADPDFLELRPVLASLDGTIYAGNMRYRAAQHLGWATIPAVFTDIAEHVAKERAIRDNQNWGEWNDSDLAAMLTELADNGRATADLGFDYQEIDALLAGIAEAEYPFLPDGDRSPFRQMTFTVTASQQEVIDAALKAAKGVGDFGDTGNENSNGNALARVCETFLTVAA